MKENLASFDEKTNLVPRSAVVLFIGQVFF